MALSKGLVEIAEYRGIEGLVAAEVLCDDNSSEEGHGYVVGDVFSIAGVAEISRVTSSSNETHYYDNMPAIVISSTGADTLTCTVSAIDAEVLAKITGQYYDATTGTFIEGNRQMSYFAIGYKTKKTNGDTIYVWRYKGTFAVPDSTHHTEDDGTSANNQSLIYTGISTTHKWDNVRNKLGEKVGAKAINVDLGKGLVSQETIDDFFDDVTTPDDLESASTYYNVSNMLTHAANSNTAAKVEGETAYSATLTAESTYTLSTVAVYMGGTDVTSTAYDSSTGAVSIASVTGDIVIVATGTK